MKITIVIKVNLKYTPLLRNAYKKYKLYVSLSLHLNQFHKYCLSTIQNTNSKQPNFK